MKWKEGYKVEGLGIEEIKEGKENLNHGKQKQEGIMVEGLNMEKKKKGREKTYDLRLYKEEGIKENLKEKKHM